MAPFAPSLVQAGPSMLCPMRAAMPTSAPVARCALVRCAPFSQSQPTNTDVNQPAESFTPFSRREALGLSVAAAASLAFSERPAQAIQGLTAGRIPGLSKEPDDAGFYQYTRPEGKSGGHGVGWSEIPQYKFKVPKTWGEIPVSIADLGGTEIDLRYQSKEQGDIAVVVAPVLRFMDLGFNAKVTLKEIGPPQRVIEGFAPELFGKPLDEEDVLTTEAGLLEDGGLYYQWEVKPHRLVSATATRNRMFIMTVTSTPRQWKKHSEELREIWKSFRVAQGP